MTLVGIPYFWGKNSIKFEAEVSKIYSNEFLSKVFDRLDIFDVEQRNEFASFLKRTSAGYLTGKDINAGRIQPHRQKKMFKKYSSALRETQKQYQEVMENSSTSGNYNASIRDIVKGLDDPGMREMFAPYVTMGDGEKELGGISITLFDKFLGVLVEAAEKAPGYINENDKANLDKEYVLWWVDRLSRYWPDYTDVSFALGDWFTNEELGIDKSDLLKKKGLYKSLCLDVLYELLSVVDKKVTRADIETAMRKFKKI